MSNQMKKNIDGVIFPVSDTVLLPGTVTVIDIEDSDLTQLRYPGNEDTANIALPLKQNFEQHALKEDDFFKIGATFLVKEVERSEKGHQLTIQITDKIEVKALTFENGIIHVQYELCPDQADLDGNARNEMLGYLRKVVHDISGKFRGGEQFIRISDEFEDLNSFILYFSTR